MHPSVPSFSPHLQGLTILPAPMPPALAACIIFGIWLLVAITIYIIFSPRKKASAPVEMNKSDVPLTSYSLLNSNTADGYSRQTSEYTRQDSKMSNASTQNSSPAKNNASNGPQPLKKSVISDEKMIQLRKKSLDFFEAMKQREMLDIQYGLTQPVIPEQSEPGVDSNKSSGERSSSKSDSLEEEDHPPSSSELLSPVSPPFEKPTFALTMASEDSDTDDTIDKPVSALILADTSFTPPDSPEPLREAHSFTCGQSSMVDSDDSDSDPATSARVTRHSKRVYRSATSLPTTPPRVSTSSQANATSSPRPSRSPVSMMERRRKPALIPPPIITTTPDKPDGGVITECPLGHGTPGSRRRSPTPTSDCASANPSPKPRRKKVSVAQMEATVFPPTPINLEPPSHVKRSPSYSRLRPAEQEAAFADNALRSVMLMSHEAIICANSSGEIVFWSQGGVKMFGYTPGEAIGCSLDVSNPKCVLHVIPIFTPSDVCACGHLLLFNLTWSTHSTHTFDLPS